MSNNCCGTGGTVMILSCSGGSNTGQMANRAAVELTQEGYGKIFCLAGIGGRLSGFVQSAKDVDQMIVIDGCEIACGKATLETAGVPMKHHLIVTELGIEKNKNFNLDPKDVATVKEAVKKNFNQPLSHSARPNMSGGGCCCGSSS